MWTTKQSCTECSTCCIFEESEAYFAPVFTKDEANRIKVKTKGKFSDMFQTYKKSKNIFQIKLIRSKKNKAVYVCPFLDEKTHTCKIYNIRPLDCKIWPLIVMWDKNHKKAQLVCYSKETCCITYKMSKKDFDLFIKKLVDFFKKNKFIKTYKKYPDLVWDYEDDTEFIEDLNM